MATSPELHLTEAALPSGWSRLRHDFHPEPREGDWVWVQARVTGPVGERGVVAIQTLGLGRHGQVVPLSEGYVHTALLRLSAGTRWRRVRRRWRRACRAFRAGWHGREQ